MASLKHPGTHRKLLSETADAPPLNRLKLVINNSFLLIFFQDYDAILAPFVCIICPVHVLTLFTPTSEHGACEWRSLGLTIRRYSRTPKGAGGSYE